MRPLRALAAGTIAVLLTAQPALACGGLIAPDGNIQLGRTTTMAAYHDGVEHYVTSFEFSGGGSKFGSIVPLPGVPTDVVKGGDWTLQRLIQETSPRQFFALDAAGGEAATLRSSAKVLQTHEIKALDITILEGGGDEVGVWATDNGFQLSPDSPEVLDFYAARSPIFMAVSYNLARARKFGIDLGEGTPIHLSIPTPNPWVPLRILTLGASSSDRIEADVFLLTDRRPNMLPLPDFARTMNLEYSEAASPFLLSDLGSDKGMEWVPDEGMWLSKVVVDGKAGDLTHDLAIDPTGTAVPSAVQAGLMDPITNVIESIPAEQATQWWTWVLILLLGAAMWRASNRFITSGS